ncbi:MAG: hypothetical protein HYT73_03020 [Candidatus Aenigmarchaeota archaeon]|nr:hypothetical protein [Candidatus Aenigmarchaeota archaeon]
MYIEYSDEEIKMEKVLTPLDSFVIKFIDILDSLGIRYALISGYVSILFGRSRSSEDVDIIIDRLNKEKFSELWKKLDEDFECIITKDADGAYSVYMSKGYAIRFSEKERFIPNIEMKFPKLELELWVLENAKNVSLNGHRMLISPLELQIPFKLYLGSEKDIEDARHLYRLFKDKLDQIMLQDFTRKLKVNEQFNKYL